MSYHRTAVFKVHNPSGRKLRRVRRMQRRYSSSYGSALWALKERDEGTIESFPGLGESEAMELVEELIGEQPLEGAMWSGLIEDLQQAVQTYLDTPDANFPTPAGTSATPLEELLDRLLGPITRGEEEELKAELKRKGETYERPINFARFRDNPIIRSKDVEKLWVAPHLQGREDSQTGALPPNGESVRDTWSYSTGSYHWKRQEYKETLPIECSRWHMHRFFREGTPKSSKVHVVDGEIYIYYSFEFGDPEGGYEIGNPVMGIDRGEVITAAYTVVGPDGTVLEDGSSVSEALRERLKEIDREIAAVQERGEHPGKLWTRRRNLVQDALHRISNRIIETASRHESAIAFENLENLSHLEDPRMTRRQFSRLAKYVRYKAEEEGLWADVEVHPAGTSKTCPECGYWDKKNRQTRSEFVCTSCGHEAHADLNAARVIGIRALWQINGGKDGTGCETLTEYVKSLSQTRQNQKEAPRPS